MYRSRSLHSLCQIFLNFQHRFPLVFIRLTNGNNGFVVPMYILHFNASLIPPWKESTNRLPKINLPSKLGMSIPLRRHQSCTISHPSCPDGNPSQQHAPTPFSIKQWRCGPTVASSKIKTLAFIPLFPFLYFAMTIYRAFSASAIDFHFFHLTWLS